MRFDKYILIIFVLIFLTEDNVFSQNTDFEYFLDLQIEKAISRGQLSQYPVIIVQGMPIDSTNRYEIFSILEKSDIKELSILDSKKASEIFDGNARNGVLLVICNRNGKKKLRKIDKPTTYDKTD